MLRLDTNGFISKSKQIFSDKFDYSLVEYKDQYTLVTLICKEHNFKFDVVPKQHYKAVSGGCKLCYADNLSKERKGKPSPLRKTREKFIEESIAKHKDKDGNPKYEYHTLNYQGNKLPVYLFCVACQKKFKTYVGDHLYKGTGCPKCGEKNKKKRTTNRDFNKVLELASLYHSKEDGSLKYEYINDKELYPHTSTISYRCPVHNVIITQQVGEHFRKSRPAGCEKCATDARKKYTEKEFYALISETSSYFNHKYDYSHLKYSDYKGLKWSIALYCPIHKKEWNANFNNHFLLKTGCPSCGFSLSKEEITSNIKKNQDTFIDFSSIKLRYLNNSVFVKDLYIDNILCTKHNTIYSQKYRQLCKGAKACPFCSEVGTSKAERELAFWIKDSLCLDITQNIRPSWFVLPGGLAPSEIDIFIPSLNVGIEYNGSTTHHSKETSDPYLKDKFKYKDYHKDKYELCKKNGITLIHVFEFENELKWKRILSNYLKAPEEYEVQFFNNKRSYDGLEYYGQTKIIKRQKKLL